MVFLLNNIGKPSKFWFKKHFLKNASYQHDYIKYIRDESIFELDEAECLTEEQIIQLNNINIIYFLIKKDIQLVDVQTLLVKDVHHGVII